AGVISFNLYDFPGTETTTGAAGDVDVTFFHGVTDAPQVGVRGADSGTDFVSGFSYSATSSAPQFTPAAPEVLEVFAPPGTTTIFETDAPVDFTGFADLGVVALASGFLTPANNSSDPNRDFNVIVVSPDGTVTPLTLVAPPS
ncbi:MAG: hypothetical protein AAGI01_04230, partial [Myxococcota bacterium]